MSDYVIKIINDLIGIEGKYSDHPADKGGPTCWGVTEKTARSAGYIGDMKELPREFAFKLYFDKFYREPWFDRIALMSPIVAEELFEAGVNFSPRIPSGWFQRWLNAFNLEEKTYSDIKIDERIGLRTIDAFRSFLVHRGSEGEMVMLTALNCSQAARYLELVEARESDENFIYGWIRARVFGNLKDKI